MSVTGRFADPPVELDAAPLVLRRAAVHDAEGLAHAVRESLEHLAPWMPWATPEAATGAAQHARLAAEQWGPEEYSYLMILPGVGIVGACALHRRIGPAGLEIGYWVHADHARQGYAALAAAALTRAALSLPGIERVEIQCDEGNVASAGVPRRLGYRLDRIVPHSIDSPAQTGRFMIWVLDGSTGLTPRLGADLTACEDLVHEVQLLDGYPPHLPGGEARRFLAAEALGAWVSRDGNAVTGHVALHSRSAPEVMAVAARVLGQQAQGLGLVARLMVSPAYRRTGLGRRLLATAARAADSRGLQPILDVARQFEAAIALYEAAGWTRLGPAKIRFRDGTTLEEWVYALLPGN